ncbi:EF-hand calcium-binding domain-containing protein 11 isoform X4 [Talpa occidentalis]|uniref:EF-hand calcium-binding domain-containing protein 11 isoform X4 n=1 Tax=Talpa occidentalis TaxID=50954 RepID=UPI0023F8CA51|nr:EF-hand calcium-binding domain-containing protein 11 isoform X4 [Talpa occidentalis]
MVFKACDEDNKGYLSREDFKVAVVMLFGYKPSKIEANSAMTSINPNASGILLEEFLNIVRKKKEAQLFWNETRHIFSAFDRHYRGYLTLEDFQKAFGLVAPRLPERSVLDVFRLIMRKISDKFRDSLQNIWPALLKTVQVIKTRECLRNCHCQEKSKETSQQNII